MATSSDTQRAAVRERKRLAHVALRERHQRQEAAQAAAFSALDRLARQLDQAALEVGNEVGDPLDRAASITAIALTLERLLSEVRGAAGELAATAGLSQAEVAELLGTRANLLFSRPRAASVRGGAASRHHTDLSSGAGWAQAGSPPRSDDAGST